MSDKIHEYRGKAVVIHFDGARCIHSRNCVLGHPEVFVANAKGAWVHPDAGSPEEIAMVIHACPSGALTYERLDDAAQEAPPLVNVVRVLENGPLAFRAELDISGEEKCFRATLCRCGASQTKPFCDGTHTAAKFIATGEPPVTDPGPVLETKNGPLKAIPQRNGPLYVQGNLEICSGTGHTVQRCTEAWLCRCGHSGNKPFCDGTHKKIGFEAAGA